MKNKTRPPFRHIPCLLLIFTMLTLSFGSLAQKTNIDCANIPAGPYAAGGTIGIPVKTTEVITDSTNKFQVYLSNAAGNFVSTTPIGSFTGIYTPQIQGLIPAGTPPGTYKIRITTSKPATTSAECTITIAAGSPVTASVTPLYSYLVLETNAIFGWCAGDIKNQIVLNNTSTTGATVQGVLINNATGAAINVPFDAANNSWKLDLTDLTDYTFIVTAEKGGVKSSKSYTIVNNNASLNLSNPGKPDRCTNSLDTVKLGIATDNIKGIGDNYKGMQYYIDWDDGTAREVYTYYQLMELLKGTIEHVYKKTSCGNTNNKFNVTIRFSKPFTGGVCPNTNIGTSILVYERPEPRFTYNNPSCVNKKVRFTNTSLIGKGTLSYDCSGLATFIWFVDGIRVSKTQDEQPTATPPNLDYTFTKTGIHTVTLQMSNLACKDTSITKTICIEDEPDPNFKIDKNWVCVNNNTPVKTSQDTATGKFFCNAAIPFTESWQIIDSVTGKDAPTSSYIADKALTGSYPTFTFKKAGTYYIKHNVSNSCGTFSKNQKVNVYQNSVSLPSAKVYCGTQTLEFSKNTPNHFPDYSTTNGIYQWTVTGGAFEWVNSSATDRYPTIKFKDYAKYTVTVKFGNDCGDNTASQDITFSQALSVSITKPARGITLCYDATSINLEGQHNGGAASGTVWSQNAGADGTFTKTTTDNTDYKFGTNDKKNGSVILTYTVTPVNSVCPVEKDTIKVKFFPDNFGTNATDKICSEGKQTYQPVSSVIGSTFTWTAKLIEGSATGFHNQVTATTNPITEPLTNNSNAVKAVVEYTITPYANNCTGTSYTYTVTVHPRPTLTVKPDETIICSGNSTSIKLESTISNTFYAWTTPATTPVTGNKAGGTTDASNIVTIKDQLSNTSNNPGTVTYTITAKSPEGCLSDPATQSIEVRPRVTAAKAGTDQKLCQATEVTLAGNTPTVGTGKWTLTSTPAAAIVNPAIYNTRVTGLQEGNEYTFKWTITGDGNTCPASDDDVTIYVRPEVSAPDAGKDIVFCTFESGSASNKVTLGAAAVTRSYETGTWSITSRPAGSTYSFKSTTTANTEFSFSNPGTYILKWTVAGDAGCPSKSDEVTVEVYETPVSGGVITTTPKVCAGSNIDFTLSGFTGAISKWQYNPDPEHGGTWQDISNTTATIQFPNVQDTFDVRAVVISSGANSSCPATIETPSVRAFVSAPTVGGTTGDDDKVCKSINNGTVKLTGHVGTVVSWQTASGKNGPWTDVGNANVTDYGYSNLTATTWFRARVKNGSCPEAYSTPTEITVVEPVSAANAGSDLKLCNVSTATLTGNTPVGNEKGKWEQLPGVNTATMSDVTKPVLNLSDLTTGVYKFNWSVSNDPCPVKSASVTVTISSSAIGGTTEKDATYCKGTDDDNLTLNGYFGSVNKWQSSIDGGTNWTDIANTQTSLPYKNLPQTTTFRAVIVNGFCTVPVYSTPATITIKPPVTIAKAGPDQELCNSTDATLQANAVAAGETGTWSQTEGAAVTLSDLNKPQLDISGLVPGIYKFQWEIDNKGTCPPAKDEVIITVYPPLVNKIDNTPITICEGQLVNILSQEVSGGKGTGHYVYQWQYSDDNQITWKDFGTNATAADFSFIGTKTVYVRRHVISGPCDTYSDPTKVTVQPGLANNTLSANETICTNTAAAEIQGSLPAGGDNTYIYVWEQSIDNGSTWAVIPGATSQNYDPGILTQTTQYRRIVSTVLCSGLQNNTINTITKTVNPDARALFSALKTNGCAPFNITAQNIATSEFPDRNDVYTWKVDDKEIGTHAIFPGYTIAKADESVTVKLVVTSKFGCKADSMDMKFYSAAPANPSFTVSPDNSCGPVKVKFTNTSLSSTRMSYAWDFGNGLTSSEYDPGEIEYDINPERRDTIYHAKLAITTACTTDEFIVPITVRSKPKAAFTPSKTSGCSPFHVVFNNNSMGERTTYTWSFDDGSADTVTTSTGVVEHTFITYTPQTYKIKLVAVNECGTDELIYNLVVSPNTVRLNMAVNGDERIGCAPLKVNFNNNTRGANAFHWDFGDGNQLNTTNGIETISHEFTQPGKYQITLVASNGCSDTTGYENVEVLATPKVTFTAVPGEVCIGDSVTFRNESDPVTGITWSFGDGKTSTLTDPKHAYTAANTYNVTMEGAIQYSGGISCKASITKPVKVIPSLTGDFTASTLLGECVPFTITFTNTTKPSALTKWNFGDGSNATGDVVTHTYTANGDYTVTMEALHPHGCTYIASKTVEIKGPEGQFNYDFGYICKDKPVRFEAYAVRTTGYTWVFGDGDTLVTNDNIVYHVYKQSGTYTPSVQLRRNDCGIWLKGQDQIKVDYYKAGFSQVQQQGCGNSVIAFQDTSRSGFGIAARAWDFGDGGTATSAQPQHTYTSTNSWPVTLIITSVSGCKDTVTTPVYAQPHRHPKAAIVNSASGCVQQEVVYTAVVTSDDPVTLYSWTFGNGTTADGVTVKNKYATSGIYQATLITGTEYGCYDTVKSPMTIYPTPVIGISKDVTICKGQSAQLGAAGATTVAWTPTEGLSCTSCANPVASPAATTQYVISGMNNYGCVSSDSVTVNVIQPSKIAVSPNDTICVGQSVQLKAEGTYRYTWTPAASLSVSNIAAPVASPVLTTTYRVEGTDEKNCFRDVATITITVGNWPKVSLGPDKVLPTGTELQLAAAVSNGPITKWSWAPAKELSCADCALPTAIIKKNACYSVIAENVFHCEARDTICITSFCENTQVFIPNAFVPTGTSNNILMVRGKGIKQVKSFRIFNRWGQMVFDKANFPPNEKAFGWDGRVNGVPASPEVYVYTCEVICEDDKMFTYKGNVAILK
ncbi:PKD domain-containing protein [Filimonas effusa]|nr:PKD domain-containing protein [Filimonas effusa]